MLVGSPKTIRTKSIHLLRCKDPISHYTRFLDVAKYHVRGFQVNLIRFLPWLITSDCKHLVRQITVMEIMRIFRNHYINFTREKLKRSSINYCRPYVCLQEYHCYRSKLTVIGLINECWKFGITGGDRTVFTRHEHPGCDNQGCIGDLVIGS